MAYDSSRGVVVLFDGIYWLNDTWKWDGIDWTQKFPASKPSTRGYHSMAYDSARGVVVLFGGYGSSGDLADTWEY